MTTLTVNIEDKKTEKAVKAVLDAFGLNYDVNKQSAPADRPLNKSEQVIYDNLKGSLEQIKLHRQGKIKLQNAKEAIAELEASLED